MVSPLRRGILSHIDVYDFGHVCYELLAGLRLGLFAAETYYCIEL